MNSIIDNKTNELPLGTLYDLNKQAMLTQTSLNTKEINAIIPALKEWFNQQIDGYAMLLCRERYDFTVFHLYEKANPNPPEIAAQELIEVLNNRGKILSIERADDTHTLGMDWEIWLKIGKETFAYYLFQCDDWVIEC